MLHSQEVPLSRFLSRNTAKYLLNSKRCRFLPVLFASRKRNVLVFIGPLLRMWDTGIDRYDSGRRILALSLFISKHRNAVMNKWPDESSKASHLIMHIVEKISAVLAEPRQKCLRSANERAQNAYPLTRQSARNLSRIQSCTLDSLFSVPTSELWTDIYCVPTL